MSKFHDIRMRSIDGDLVDLDRYRGRHCLVVNVASRCGLTPQYTALQALHEANKDRGFTVLGFPCNQFGRQEPGTNEDIREFTESKYGVDFPLFDKVEVNGEGTCALYAELKRQKPGDIAWNFTKFLVDGDGEVVERFEPRVTPEEIGRKLGECL